MATFAGNAAGYRISHTTDGQISVEDIDAGDGGLGTVTVLSGIEPLQFADRDYGLAWEETISPASETLVNVGHTSGNQMNSSFASLADGSYVAVWLDETEGKSYVQRYGTDGNAIGSPTEIAALTNDSIKVVSLGDGYAISWDQGSASNSSGAVVTNIYDADGVLVADGSRTNATATHYEIASLANDSYVIAWANGSDVFLDRFDSTGSSVLTFPPLVATDTSHIASESQLAIAGLTGGDFVVVWSSETSRDIYMQRFGGSVTDQPGTLDNTLVNDTATDLTQGDPAIAALEDGGFVITWTSPDGNSTGIFGQRYDSSGTAVGEDAFQINATSSGEQFGATVTALVGGGYAVVWASDQGNETGFYDIYARRYDAAGDAVGGEFRVNDTTASVQYQPSVTALADGDFIVSWTTLDQPDTPSENTEIYSKRYDVDPYAVLRIEGSSQSDALYGGNGSQKLVGLGGNDTLDGGSGADTLIGGAGNDIYVVNAGDVVVEEANAGTDTVKASVNYVLGATLENLTLTDSSNLAATGNGLNNVLIGNGGGNTLTGNAGNDTLSGGAGNDTLNGGEGNDTLDGGSGSDTLIGGNGNDIYIVGTGDTVNDAGGTDTVKASITYTLTGTLENLTLTGSGKINGTGNGLNNVITGNSGANTLTGGAGNDTLDGGSGTDKLAGGTGNDTYLLGSGDSVSESVNAGNDTVKTSLTYTLGSNLENLTLTGSSAINGTGNSLANVITGNGAANTVSGGSGNDTLNGGLGNDKLVGGSGNDIFRFTTALNASSNKDTINDYVAANDTFQLDNAVFKKLTATGALKAVNFKASASGNAGDSNDFILYETDTGKLFYDADGNGAGAKIQFALVGSSTHPALSASEFVVV